MNKVLGKVIVGFTASAVVATMGLTSAFAATTSFDSQYQTNLTKEQSLLAQVPSSSSDTTVAELLSTVQSINTQVSALYSAEQALSNAKTSIPQVHTVSDTVKKLQLTREQLLKQSNTVWNLVGRYEHHWHDKNLLNKAVKEHDGIEKQLQEVNRQITACNTDNGWNTNSYNGGLEALQDSILKLQSSAIHYTEEAITLEKSTAPTTTTTSTTSNVTVTSTN
ncbi:hypothetical protein [Alicyclobacillus fastidiosus]|uniref:hypothetical protein n=1 Tax=Alicyclobacillus fastidiosus TaxID=392011 RepID=UPI0023E97595|nr:hypothetical protein [Alicyclobacillus fastidiosus]GMA66116.1 hypothetical protein GCM10025859_65580 [Alicyclobacillus fastidiosus]